MVMVKAVLTSFIYTDILIPEQEQPKELKVSQQTVLIKTVSTQNSKLSCSEAGPEHCAS
jgi:hypothetical protein